MKEIKTLFHLLRKKPVYVAFYVTRECNFKCRMCRLNDQKPAGEIDLGKVREIAERLKALGLTVVNISGGEPLLVKKLSGVIRIFKNYFSVRMQTNAYSVDEGRVRELAAAVLDAVSVSLHSISPEKQDTLCGVNGAWEKIVENMLLFASLLPAREGPLIMNSVVSTLNIRELPALVKLGNCLGFYSAFVPLLFTEAARDDYVFRVHVPQFRFTARDRPLVESTYARIVEMKREGYSVADSDQLLRISPEYLLTNQRQWKCDAGELYFVLNHHGDFSICTEMRPIGNILDDIFYEDYRSGKWKDKFRRMIAGCPDCHHPCFAELSLMRTSLRVLREQALKKVFSRSRKRQLPSLDEVKHFQRRLLDEVEANP